MQLKTKGQGSESSLSSPWPLVFNYLARIATEAIEDCSVLHKIPRLKKDEEVMTSRSESSLSSPWPLVFNYLARIATEAIEDCSVLHKISRLKKDEEVMTSRSESSLSSL
ncbi:hypothetical protein [Fusibacter sp. JL216-2]|uniref:hypothetical protein n=1 Tax=Fusibacter sp. JL216-2 TaxID=3071453 RepID=UPI003D32D64E